MIKKAYTAAEQDRLQLEAPQSRFGEDSLLGSDYYSILDNSLDLARNSAVTRSIIQVLEDYIAGNGLTPALGDPIGLQVWGKWSNGAVNLAGTKSFNQVFRDIVSNVASSGDVLVTTPIDKNARPNEIALRLELTSGSRIRTPQEFTNKKDDSGRIVKFGVAFSDGVEVGYYIQRQPDPSIPAFERTKKKNFTYVSKVDNKTGRLNAFLIRRPTGMPAEQTRGLPIITPVVQDIKDLDDLMLSAIQGSRNKALLSVILTGNDSKGIYGGAGAVDSTGALIEATDNNGEAQIIGSLPDGAIMTAPEGTNAQVINSSGEIDRDSLMLRSMRLIAAGVGVPYEILFKDFSATNFSSGKLALDSFFRLSEFWTIELSAFFGAIYRQIQIEAHLKGFGLEAPTYENTIVQFIGSQNFVDADPGKNSKAETERMKNNLTTSTREAARRGILYSDILLEKSQEYLKAVEISEAQNVPIGFLLNQGEAETIVTEINTEEEGE
jgi:capsid protein